MKRAVSTILLAFAFCLASVAGNWHYQTINAPKGRTNDFLCAYVEPHGYAWGGLKHGLFRFGYMQDFRWYFADGTPGSIPSNHIVKITVDPLGRTAICTDEGIALYDMANDNFIRICKFRDGVASTVKGYCFLAAPDGTYYMGGDGAVHVYDPESATVLGTMSLGLGEAYRVEDMVEKGDGVIELVNNTLGVREFRPESGSLWEPENSLGENTVHYYDSKGRFWRSRYNRGVECYDRDGSLLATYSTADSELTSNIVTAFLERGNEMFIGTDGGGINVLDLETGKISAFTRVPGTFNSFPSASVSTLSLTADNSVWATTPEGNAIILKEVNMTNYAIAPIQSQSGRFSDSILSICSLPGDTERLLIGTANSGMFSFNVASDDGQAPEIRHIASTGNRKIDSMILLPDGNVLMAYANEGLFVYHTANGTVTAFQTDLGKEFNDNVRYTSSSVNLCYDDQGNIMILSGDAWLFNPETKSVSRYPTPSHKGHDAILPISNSGGRYFFCERYLFEWDKLEKMHRIIFDFGEDIYVNSATMDPDGKIWVGTDSGMFTFTKGASAAEKVELEGISEVDVVFASPSGNIWTGGGSKMHVFYPSSGNLIIFTENEGATWNRYYGKSVCDTGRHLCLGGTNGLLFINPRFNPKKEDKAEIIVTDVFIDSGRVPGIPDRFSLHPRFRTLGINFFVKEDDILREKTFKYEIAGPDRTEIIKKQEAKLHFATLTTGNYSIKVSYTTADGYWTEPVELISFRVRPVWYRTALFWLLLLSTIAVAGLLSVRRIRRRTNMKLELAKSQAEAKAGQDSVKFFLNVSHELKTPLTLIISPLSRILKTKDRNDPEYNTLKNIYKQAGRMSNLILTVLDAHKIKDGSAKLNASHEDLNKWVDTLTSAFDEEAESRSIKMIRMFDPGTELVAIDAPKLENVMTNMLINALKHSPDGTVITVGTRYMPKEDVIRVFVSDQGEGLGGIDMTKLFSRYYQGYAQKTGSGLGLAYADSIVALHGGHMGAYENRDRGSTFYFDLPGSSRMKKPASTGGSGTAGSVSIDSASVLIVDDDNDLRDYIASAIKPACRNVFTANNGKSALDVLGSEDIDVVVSDVMMPVMDGFELLSTIKRTPELSHIPVILLTARIGGNSKEHGIALGADAFLPKPFEEEELKKAISETLKKG